MQERPSSPVETAKRADHCGSYAGLNGPKGAVNCCTSSWYPMLLNALPENFDGIAIMANSSESSNFLVSIFNGSMNAQMPSYKAYYGAD